MLTSKQLMNGLLTAVDCYNNAAEATDSAEVKQYLTNKWALIRQIAQIMASRQESDLKVFIDEAKKWEMDCKNSS